MLRLVLPLLILFFCGRAAASSFDRLFSVVMIDAQTERQLGAIPLRRQWIAEAIDKLADAGARAIILKFFLDRERDAAGDEYLARSLSRLPVVLQGRIDDNERFPNPLPKRFYLPYPAASTIQGKAGWIPLARFSRHAADIGFADFDGFPVSLVARYQDGTVKSLLLSAMEFALGAKAILVDGQKLTINDRRFYIDRYNRVPVSVQAGNKVPYLPFHEVLHNGNLGAIKGKVVIIGYNGDKMHQISTPQGSFAGHELFVRILRQLIDETDGGTMDK